jgi:transcriptional regulator with XRE-family HTH domain
MRSSEKLAKAVRHRGKSTSDIVRALEETGDPTLTASKATVNRWMRGESEPSVRQALLLARLLDTSVEALFEEHDESASPAAAAAEGPSQEEQQVLVLVRRLGIETALDRLLQISRSGARPVHPAGNPPATQETGQ